MEQFAAGFTLHRVVASVNTAMVFTLDGIGDGFWNMNEFQLEFLTSVKELHELEIVPSTTDDSTDSYSRKYKMRELLNAIVEKGKTLLSNDDIYTQVVWGICSLKLANIFIETEDQKNGAKTRLLEVVTYFEAKNDLTNFAGVLQYAYNSLAIAAGVEYEASNQPVLEWLNKARNLYHEYRQISNGTEGPHCWESISNFSSAAERDCLIRFAIFETGYITTLFLLAQVYSNLKEKQKSAEFCQETLLRQLKLAPTMNDLQKCLIVVESGRTGSDKLVESLPSFDPIEWAVNASTLSEYYSEIGANLPISEVDCAKSDQSGTKSWADVARLAAQYSLKLLKQGSEEITASESGVNSNEGLRSVCYGDLFNHDTTTALQEAYGESVDELDIDTVISALTSPPKTYLEAARLFRWTCKCISEALLYYKLDEHCSDAVELCCMQKRRVGLLENLLHELNPQFYMTSCRILMSECAEALTTLRDLNEQKLERATQKKNGETLQDLSKQAKKVNSLTRRAIDVYTRLLDSFLAPATQKPVEFYEETWLQSVLRAYFYSARLHSKIITPGPTRKSLTNLLKARENYEKMVEIADKHAANGYKYDVPEVEIAREMIILMTAKIARIPLPE
ncbi:unnamed protein product [Hymenolepis diminuta]|uniref:KIF-binding protein n=2 Tax=Hymenolepis diminuta TaxID=6216 RepID=A0A0R3SJU3_HYMDI|nr:unnamed protein product [Hymenolepis diminuta]